MYQALYRKYRPSVFSDVCGQEHITSVLRYETESGRVSHAYLFCGSRGTGKTTTAKVLSRAINCTNSPTGEPCGECDVCKFKPEIVHLCEGGEIFGLMPGEAPEMWNLTRPEEIEAVKKCVMQF